MTDTDPGAALELLASMYDEGDITEVIRPSAILNEEAARAVLGELSLNDARAGGLWLAEPSNWRRYDRPWDSPDNEGSSVLVGTIQVMYGTPTRHEITVYRATVTGAAAAAGWSVTLLCDDALQYAGLTLASCPRANLQPPPQPFRFNR